MADINDPNLDNAFEEALHGLSTPSQTAGLPPLSPAAREAPPVSSSPGAAGGATRPPPQNFAMGSHLSRSAQAPAAQPRSYEDRLAAYQARREARGDTAAEAGAGPARDPDAVAHAIAAGALRVPGRVVGGLIDLSQDLNPQTASTRMWMARAGIGPPQGSWASTLSLRSSLGQIGNPDYNEAAASLFSLIAGYAGVGLISRLSGAGAAFTASTRLPYLSSVAARSGPLVQGATADFALLDPEQERFSNFLQSAGVHSEFTDWLAHNDQEGHLAGRFKNALEGAMGGIVLDRVVRGTVSAADRLFGVARFFRASLRGEASEAEIIQREIQGSTPAPPEVADHPVVEEVAPEESAKLARETGSPSIRRGNEVLSDWGQAEDGTQFPIYAPREQAEAEAAASLPSASEAEGAAAAREAQAEDAGKDPTLEETPAEVAARDEADAVAADETIVFRRTDTQTVVGSIDRQGLTELGQDIEMFRAVTSVAGDRGADITHQFTQDVAGRVGEMRLGPLGSSDNVPGFLRALMERVPEAKAPRADADLMRDAVRASNAVGEDPVAMLEAARLIAGKLGDADTAMATLRTIWTRYAKDLDSLHLPGRDWMTASEDEADQAFQAVHNITSLSAYVQDAKQGLGRGIRTNKLPDADTYMLSLPKSEREVVPGAARSMAPLPRTRQELTDWMEIWERYKNDPARRAAFLQARLNVPTGWKYIRQSAANFFTGAILSMPRTLLLNLVGPGILNTVRTMERLSGASMAALNPALSAAERADARLVAKNAMPAFFSSFGETSDVLNHALLAAENNRSVIGGGGTFDPTAAFGPFDANLLNAAGMKASWHYKLGNAINVFPRAVSRINSGMDEFSKRLAYLGEVRVKAMVEGAQEGLEGNALHEFIGTRLQGSFDEVGRASDLEGLRAAERSTLTAQVGEEGTFTRRLANGINQVRRDVPEVRYILPVFNVPANGLGETLRRLPIAFVPGVNKALGFQRTAGELAGDFGPVAQADAHGRFLTGAAFLLAGLLGTRAGILTGAGPQDPIDRRLWLQTHQPYSLRLGDKWVRYDRYDVLGGLLAIPATVSDATVYRRQDRGVSELIFAGMGSLAQWFKDRAALRSASALLSLGDDPERDTASVLGRLGGSVLAGFIPAFIQGTTTQARSPGTIADPYQRMRQSWSDYLIAATPGLSQTLPPVRNLFGEPVMRAADTLGENLFPVTLAPATSFADDPELDELDRLYQQTGFGAGADARNIGMGFFDPRDVSLENGQTLYDAAMQARQHITVDGMTLRESLHELFTSDEYGSASDADPSQRTTSTGDLSRGYLVSQVFARFNQAIRAELVDGSPIADQYLTAAAAKQRDDAYLRDLTVDDLVGNRDLYRTRGIDPDAYSAHLSDGSTGQLVEALRH